MRLVPSLSAAILFLLAAPVHALPPDQIYDRVAPAVWSVKAYAAEEKLLASASGVAVAPGKLVTSCQVLARARQVQVRRGNSIYDAKLEFPDIERDLCQLDVPGLTAPALTVGSARGLRPGQRLYVVGFSRGNEQSIGEGLVSAVSEAGSAKERIQTTVPAAPGLRGAGVFDEEARLVGVVTASPADAAASTFAVPADWLAELGARGEAALAARAKPAAAATAGAAASTPGLPTAGTSWVYGFNNRIFGRGQTDFTVRAVRADAAGVEEQVTANAKDASEPHRMVNVADLRFFEHSFGSTAVLLELAPYFLARSDGKAPTAVANPNGYPVGGAGLPDWSTQARILEWEQVTVPAGTFRALRVEASGKRPAPSRSVLPTQFTLTVWYAPDIKRYVRLEHRVWFVAPFDNRLIGHDVVELLAYRPPS
jgi:S1-C subfamily serine protease